MTTQQALEQVKQIKAKYQLFYGTQDVETQALTVAISVMESTQSLTVYLTEQAKTTESRELADIFTTIISGLTRSQSDTETGI